MGLLFAVGNESYKCSFLVCHAKEGHESMSMDVVSKDNSVCIGNRAVNVNMTDEGNRTARIGTTCRGDESARLCVGRMEDRHADYGGLDFMWKGLFRAGIAGVLLNGTETLVWVARQGWGQMTYLSCSHSLHL